MYIAVASISVLLIMNRVAVSLNAVVGERPNVWRFFVVAFVIDAAAILPLFHVTVCVCCVVFV